MDTTIAPETVAEIKKVAELANDVAAKASKKPKAAKKVAKAPAKKAAKKPKKTKAPAGKSKKPAPKKAAKSRAIATSCIVPEKHKRKSRLSKPDGMRWDWRGRRWVPEDSPR